MTPVPPGLYDVYRDFTPNQLFWIVRNGIKMTAMPAWPALRRDDEVWDMVAFLEHLPAYKTADYAALSGATSATFLAGPLPTAAVHAGSIAPADCARCHGADGNGREGAYPHLAGLSRTYIEQSLLAFRNGSRPSGFMQPVAAALSDSDIEQAATFFSQQPRRADKPATADPALLKDGQTLVEGGAGVDKGAACFSCHTPDPDKRSAAIPQLTGQPADYLMTQLRLFRGGVRSGTPAAKAMAKVAHNLTDHQIEAVSAYLASLPTTP
jgi:cytochrome c553